MTDKSKIENPKSNIVMVPANVDAGGSGDSVKQT